MEEGSNALLSAGRWLGMAMLCAGLVPLQTVAGARMVTDRIDRAPVERKTASASGRYTLTVVAVDGWKTPRTSAILTDVTGRVRWRIALPHEGGPRAMLVNDKGTVLFIDEWINVIPRHALMIVAPTGKIIGDHAGETILSMLNVPRRTIGDLARVGPWRSSDAVLAADGQSASLKSGGRTVRISLVDGSVRVGT
jgi:hypothetical protein